MTANDVDRFFREYVFGFMDADIQRELATARRGEPAGNFLCALALLCYTEVLGGVRRGTLASGNGKKNFECFFRELGADYENLLDANFDAYGLLRCGMAHEYLIKGRATVTMLKGVEPGGVAVTPEDHSVFCVERYHEDFLVAARRLHQDLMASSDPRLPPELGDRA